ALLDVACGTGRIVPYLMAHYTVEGLDLDPNMLELARTKNPGVLFHPGDMADFDLGHHFDVITCLGSAIGAVRTLDRLQQAARTMARHLEPGGLAIIEPWIMPHAYKEGLVSALFVDQPDVKLARMNVSEAKDGISVLN